MSQKLWTSGLLSPCGILNLLITQKNKLLSKHKIRQQNPKSEGMKIVKLTFQNSHFKPTDFVVSSTISYFELPKKDFVTVSNLCPPQFWVNF